VIVRAGASAELDAKPAHGPADALAVDVRDAGLAVGLPWNPASRKHILGFARALDGGPEQLRGLERERQHLCAPDLRAASDDLAGLAGVAGDC
jgi:hypothetical protein